MTARIEFTVTFAAGKQRHRLDRRHARMYTPDDTICPPATTEVAIENYKKHRDVHQV